jgi:hypothetical protein
MNILTASPTELLKSKALDLFKSEAEADKTYKALAKLWHPDLNHDNRASEVFAHISAKLVEAKKAFANGGYPNTLKIKETLYPYISCISFELGEIYVCPRHIIYATERRYDDLAKRWLETVKAFKFPNEDVKAKLADVLPKNSHTFASGDRAFTICNRSPNQLRLADILAAKGAMDPKAVAWCLSRAYNIAGFLRYSKINHYDISVETFFVDPATHVGALYGGWFYAGMPKPLAAPARSSHLVSADPKMIADAQIRIMGRRLLGCQTVQQLRAKKDVPESIKNWLLGPANSDIHAAEAGWQKAIIAAFGERKFTVCPISQDEVYSS